MRVVRMEKLKTWWSSKIGDLIAGVRVRAHPSGSPICF